MTAVGGTWSMGRGAWAMRARERERAPKGEDMEGAGGNAPAAPTAVRHRGAQHTLELRTAIRRCGPRAGQAQATHGAGRGGSGLGKGGGTNGADMSAVMSGKNWARVQTWGE